jgi:hypothetical protein
MEHRQEGHRDAGLKYLVTWGRHAASVAKGSCAYPNSLPGYVGRFQGKEPLRNGLSRFTLDTPSEVLVR